MNRWVFDKVCLKCYSIAIMILKRITKNVLDLPKGLAPDGKKNMIFVICTRIIFFLAGASPCGPTQKKNLFIIVGLVFFVRVLVY